MTRLERARRHPQSLVGAKRGRRGLLAALVVCGALAYAGFPSSSHHHPVHYAHPAGFVVLAEHRFDPAVQRLMAEQNLKALPIYGGALFYIVPEPSNAAAEAMQIQYMESLLRRHGREIEPEAE